MGGPDYQLPQQAGDPQPVTLGPGASAASRLTFLAEPNGWVPNTIAVSLPNSPGRLEAPWIAGGVPVARQDAASHPGELHRTAAAGAACMMDTQQLADELNHPGAQMLLGGSMARLAYNGHDGFPRVIPVGFLLDR